MKRVVEWLSSPPKEDASLILLTVCDCEYYFYAESLINSANIFSPGLTVVLHIINPDKTVLHLMKDLLISAKNISLHVSTERTNLDAIPSSDLKTYYASARFLRIPELLKEFQCDILTVDSDSLLVNNFDDDFTDKEEADICLIRRDLDKEVDLRLAVATGTIYSRYRPATLKFYSALDAELRAHFKKGDMPWFLDQVLFAKTMYAMKAVAVRNIKRKYADWTFRDNSIIWAGKGDLKTSDLKFATLQNLCSSNEFKRVNFLKSLYTFSKKSRLESGVFYKKVELLRSSFKPIATIYLPRLDLPWKKPASDHKITALSVDALKLRSYWKHFCIGLANALEREGFYVDIQEIPAWEITPDLVNNTPSCFALIPHRCKLDFAYHKVSFPVMFYMQEYFSWMFTVDKRGWSAASTIYPIDYYSLPQCTNNHYASYEARLSNGLLDSKFSQLDRQSVAKLVELKHIPAHSDPRLPYKKFIFFPLQIPHDQSIKYFSDYDELSIIQALLEWSKLSHIPIVFKPHPASPKSMVPLLSVIEEGGGFVSNANIHDLIPLSHAVYTINSGVGFEAMFHNVPIVTFGRAEYDCVTFKANLDNLDMAWIYCLLSQRNDLKKGYARFFNWFLDEYAYDLTDSDNIEARLRYLAKRIKKSIAVAEA